jgi:hypothetical protein
LNLGIVDDSTWSKSTLLVESFDAIGNKFISEFYVWQLDLLLCICLIWFTRAALN